ncbi:mechanosensitive ion channel family protein [Mucilaginibacter segetis]|uniref:Mechanosensitive ion channel family protein n=1 Tax=Mucilaginibacter segetis TaxID=2793071 RepID=A0A934PTS5_9SPHI|nr:mechanosensitive ion channel family protein [Mucilaginibacter segetis]MBK0378920.1 mechanosensitive ion channel family protein [Mucilaginibacter segetis]
MNQTFDSIFLGNTLLAWGISILIFIGCIILIKVFKGVGLSQLKKWAARTTTTIDDFLIETIEKSVVPLLYIAAFYFAVNTLIIPASITRILHVAFLFVATYFVLGIITSFIKHFVFSFIKTQDDAEIKQKQARGLLIILNVVVWIMGFIFIINNLGYDVTTLITGLGIGGIAIALAAQTILGDLFSYFVIFFDRPFEIGDFIIVDDKMGVVDYIGIKTTRLKTLNGEQLICSNTFLTNAQVHNYKRMETRRIVFKLGVLYQTPYAQVKEIPEMVKNIIQSKEQVRFDRGHFSGFGNFSLDFEFVYYIEGSDYTLYMDKQQEIYLDIFTAFEAEKIEFAYPTQTLFLNKDTTLENNSKME